MRIVSLLPAATDIVARLGAADELVGITFECTRPPDAADARVVTSTTLPEGLTPGQIDAAVSEAADTGTDLYRLDEGALADLDPDVVLTQDLCAVCAVDATDTRSALDHLGCTAQVVTLDPTTVDEMLDSITAVGRAIGRTDEAEAAVAAMRDRLAAVARALDGAAAVRVLVLEWTEPPFGPGHWIPDMVTIAGGTPVIGTAGEPSRPLTGDELAACDAQIVVVAPCGYGLDDAAEQASAAATAGMFGDEPPVWAVDADAAFVRPAPGLIDGIEALAAIIHPERLGDPDPAIARRIR